MELYQVQPTIIIFNIPSTQMSFNDGNVRVCVFIYMYLFVYHLSLIQKHLPQKKNKIKTIRSDTILTNFQSYKNMKVVNKINKKAKPIAGIYKRGNHHERVNTQGGRVT